MKQRCYDKNCRSYVNYGARGITVCDRWRESFTEFLADMGPKPSPSHSIERENNSTGYEPGNCRWATRSEQMRNKRSSRLLFYNGEELCLAAWSEKTGIKPHAIHKRLLLGWSIERALTIPVR